MNRSDGRAADGLRAIEIVPGVSPYAEGSAEVSFGRTKLLLTASVLQDVPPWMDGTQGGWITAEYGMLPRATHTRSRREAASGKQSGRTLEIQRLIGRSLRAAVDLTQLTGLTIQIDCDVLVADGGTRTAAISGGWVALYQALQWIKHNDVLLEAPEISHIAAVSVGVVEGVELLDLEYVEDSRADFDLNLVYNDALELIELQGTAERATISRDQLDRLLDLGEAGCREIIELQQEAVLG